MSPFRRTRKSSTFGARGPAGGARLEGSRPGGRLWSGASRARTGDLSAASRTLSQLSYSPKLVVAGPVYPKSLVVLGGREPQIERGTTGCHRDRQQIAAVERLAVRG